MKFSSKKTWVENHQLKSHTCLLNLNASKYCTVHCLSPENNKVVTKLKIYPSLCKILPHTYSQNSHIQEIPTVLVPDHTTSSSSSSRFFFLGVEEGIEGVKCFQRGGERGKNPNIWQKVAVFFAIFSFWQGETSGKRAVLHFPHFFLKFK